MNIVYNITIRKIADQSIHTILNGEDYNVLYKQASDTCLLLNKVMPDGIYYIDSNITESVVPLDACYFSPAIKFIRKWVKYPDYIITFFTNFITAQDRSFLVLSHKDIFFINDFQELFKVILYANNYNRTDRGRYYLMSELLLRLKYCIDIERTYNEMIPCPPFYLIKYNEYLGLPINNTTIGGTYNESDS